MKPKTASFSSGNASDSKSLRAGNYVAERSDYPGYSTRVKRRFNFFHFIFKECLNLGIVY